MLYEGYPSDMDQLKVTPSYSSDDSSRHTFQDLKEDGIEPKNIYENAENAS